MEREADSKQLSGMRWLLFSGQGRLNRKPYWLFILANFVLQCLLFSMVGVNGLFLFISVLIFVAMFIAYICVAIKRCHDRDRSGWFVLITFVPILCLWPFIELGFLRGTIGDNKYGKDPLEESISTN